ncbi:MAG: hypothetical protein U0N94_00650 [Clostridia bacterium]
MDNSLLAVRDINHKYIVVERSVLQFAKEQEIAPGIVVGRMQMEGMIRYNMLNNLKEKYEIVV